MNGLRSPHTLLNEYIKQYVGCFPGDTGLPYLRAEPIPDNPVTLMSFEWERLLKGKFVLHSLLSLPYAP